MNYHPAKIWSNKVILEIFGHAESKSSLYLCYLKRFPFFFCQYSWQFFACFWNASTFWSKLSTQVFQNSVLIPITNRKKNEQWCRNQNWNPKYSIDLTKYWQVCWLRFHILWWSLIEADLLNAWVNTILTCRTQPFI